MNALNKLISMKKLNIEGKWVKQGDKLKVVENVQAKEEEAPEIIQNFNDQPLEVENKVKQKGTGDLGLVE